MTISVLFRYLVGDPDAIRIVASSCSASILVGGLLVLSAGLARTWNRKDLRAEPKYLLTPFLASLATSIIFALMFSIWRYRITAFPQLFPIFLGLFWMTAPIAWLYGFPFERMTTPDGAVKGRLWTLLIVSTWRVALMIRVLHVLFQVPVSHAAVPFKLIKTEGVEPDLVKSRYAVEKP